MKKLILFAIAAILLSGCSKVEDLNYQVYQSTQSINCNSAAVQQSTAVIRENGRIIEQSSQAIDANRQALEQM